MIPVTVMTIGKGTVSTSIKGEYGKRQPSRFSNVLRPVVFWNITYKCNLKCKHCYLNAGPSPSKPELDTKKLLEIADQLIEHEIPLVIFTGGEPLARDDFWIVAERLSEHKRPRLSLSTNGTLITKSVAKKLKDYGFVYVGVSIDSLNPALHDEFRGVKGAFAAAVKGIENALSEDLQVGLRTTITRWNIDEVEDIIDFASRLGVTRVSLYILDTIGRAVEIKNQMPSPSQLKEFSEKLIHITRKYPDVEVLVVRANFIGIYIASLLAKTKQEFIEYLNMLEAQGDCGRKTISIYPDGTVRPCQFIDYVIIGDLRRQKLAEILRLDNPKLRLFIEAYKMLRGDRCRRCPFRRICGGGSRNRALVLNRDFWGDEPLCFINFSELELKWDIKEVL
ncbi:MAG: radical SAM protein [Pyrodictiaceae archaeon]